MPVSYTHLVVTEYVEVFLNHRTEILAKCLHVLNEVRVDICLKATDTVVVLDQTATSGLLHHVQYVLTVAHTVKAVSYTHLDKAPYTIEIVVSTRNTLIQKP